MNISPEIMEHCISIIMTRSALNYSPLLAEQGACSDRDRQLTELSLNLPRNEQVRLLYQTRGHGCHTKSMTALEGRVPSLSPLFHAHSN